MLAAAGLGRLPSPSPPGSSLAPPFLRRPSSLLDAPPSPPPFTPPAGGQGGRDHGVGRQDVGERAGRGGGHALRPRLHLALLCHEHQDAKGAGGCRGGSEEGWRALGHEAGKELWSPAMTRRAFLEGKALQARRARPPQRAHVGAKNPLVTPGGDSWRVVAYAGEGEAGVLPPAVITSSPPPAPLSPDPPLVC